MDDICPPWWPDIIWWLIHHPPKGSDRVDERALIATENILVALHEFHAAGAIGTDLAGRVRSDAIGRMSEAVQRLASAGV
jgi:hypothetical protein